MNLSRYLRWPALALIFILSACGGGSSGGSTPVSEEDDGPIGENFEDLLIGEWSTGCHTGSISWILTIEFVDYENARDSEKEYDSYECEGTPSWSFSGTFTYNLGATFYTENNEEVTEIDITYDDGEMLYTIVYIDESGVLYFGEKEGENRGDTPATRRVAVRYRLPMYKQ
ncbi:hypothetical protein ACFSJ3_03765 [Corallincola platygyrae]|uniref:Lipocalin-like domain-containing protein n=1 Tax=Corallincola platygyrae TaxID=1193278 RepID=A0ABW4XJ62_9GAMM